MNFVAIVRKPTEPEDASRTLASVLGVTLAEARMRMAPEPPALIARLEPDAAARLTDTLRQVGVAALSMDEHAPADRDRIVARSFALVDGSATFTTRGGASVEVGWRDIVAVLRGLRAARVEEERSAKSKSFSVATALATGGLKMTRTSTKTTRSSEESSEHVVLLYPRKGQTVLLSERQLDFACLGPGIQPSSTANIAELARRVRQHANGAFYDDRLLRLGRRPLPFLAEGVSRSSTRAMTVTTTDTSRSLDVLAELMWQALKEGLLP
jgi:hypothetical protein